MTAASHCLLFVYECVGVLAAAACASAAALGRVTGSDRLLRLGERVGRYQDETRAAADGPVVWMHAASVGEVRVAEPLLAALRETLLGARFVITCQTAAGLALAEQLGADERRYFPIDCRFVARRTIAHIRPSLFLFVEAEIWPRLLLELAAADVPAAMVGARVSEASCRRYRRVRGLFAPALATLSQVCARDDASLRRLIDLGAPQLRSSVTGDVKLDAIDRDAVASTEDALAGRDESSRVLFAVSTHDGEERVVLDAFSRVRRDYPSTRLVLAPRHPRRAEDVAALAAGHGRVARWSRDHAARGWDVLVVDTTGEARTFYPAADVAFVGGTLTDVGGHNLAEPAAFAVPCVVGPHLDSVKHQAELLDAAGALVVVKDAETLACAWSEWLGDPSKARRIGQAARAAIDAQRGALARTLAALEPVLACVRARVPT